jgi:hypothetical protein
MLFWKSTRRTAESTVSEKPKHCTVTTKVTPRTFDPVLTDTEHRCALLKHFIRRAHSRARSDADSIHRKASASSIGTPTRDSCSALIKRMTGASFCGWEAITSCTDFVRIVLNFLTAMNSSLCSYRVFDASGCIQHLSTISRC